MGSQGGGDNSSIAWGCPVFVSKPRVMGSRGGGATAACMGWSCPVCVSIPKSPCMAGVLLLKVTLVIDLLYPIHCPYIVWQAWALVLCLCSQDDLSLLLTEDEVQDIIDTFEEGIKPKGRYICYPDFSASHGLPSRLSFTLCSNMRHVSYIGNELHVLVSLNT